MMTNRLFVDTSGWGAVFLANEQHHQLAAAEYAYALVQTGITIYTTDHVIAELVPFLTSRRMPRSLVVQNVDNILSHRKIKLLSTDLTLFRDAWALLKSRQDKNWSLADAISIVQMQRLGITEALTNDHHFEQAGLIRLLK